ncbi:MAG: hypothetical protein CM1200mP10_10970 [Candidatus Neomarinimicrobiota bacterium]|nr:MAG: hypothetical protein CM1200mP10_10970 [Candidatus Neomarinimicrobiota bacterium]
MAKKDKQIQFEEAFKRLEDIVTKMESGDLFIGREYDSFRRRH